MRFAPVCSVEADVVFHHPFEEAHTGTHEAVFAENLHVYSHRYVTARPALSGRRASAWALPDYRVPRIPGKAHPVVRHLSGEGQIAFIHILPRGFHLSKGIEHVGHFVAVPGAVDVRRVLRFGHIIKPVSPAQAARPLLGLHHYVSHGGEGHVAAYLPAKFLIALHADKAA